MSQTINQIRDRVANRLGIIELGGQLDHQDSIRIIQGYAEIHAYLKAQKVITWSNTALIPDSVASFIIAMVCHNCIDDFSIPAERYQRIMQDYLLAEKKIREILLPDYVSITKPVDF